MKDELESYMLFNKHHWDEAVTLHRNSRFYDIEGFKKGNLSLASVEIDEIGDVSEKSLLHLQCHFGLDTLSWARLGALVTGVDFSGNAISFAKSLSEEVGLGERATFLEANIYELPNILDKKFDIVFTSYGILNWLNDINSWAEVISHFIKPGGFFYIIDIHPITWVFDEGGKTSHLEVKNSYFGSSAPVVWITSGTYAVEDKNFVNRKTYLWQHTLGEILTSLVKNNLRIDYLHEFPVCNYPIFSFMIKSKNENMWHLPPDMSGSLPLLFSVKAFA